MTKLLWIYECVLGIFLVITIMHILVMPKLEKRPLQQRPFVTVCVPLRNERKNVDGLMASLLSLTYPNVEILLLDDQSTDGTYEKLQKYAMNYPRVTVIQGAPLEKGWIGKTFACHQLGKQATGDYLLFIDADVRIKPETIEKALGTLAHHQSKLLTGFPYFPVRHILEKWLVQLQHFIVYFHLPVLVANHTTWPSFTAATGTFLFFDKKAYDEIGGHAAIQGEIVDDVTIAREIKKAGHKVTLLNVTKDITCYMYHSNREVWEGFAKNVYSGLNRSILFVVSLTIFYSVSFVLPLFLAMYGIFTGNFFYVVPLFTIWLQRLFVDLASKQYGFSFLYQPVAIMAFIVLMFDSMRRNYTSKGYEWKGRRYE